MQLHESEENMFECMLHQINDNNLEEPLVPISEEIELLRRSFTGGIRQTLVKSSIDVPTEEITTMKKDMMSASLFDLVFEEQRCSITNSKMQLRKSRLSVEGEKKISIPNNYNKKLLKNSITKSNDSFNQQNNLHNSKTLNNNKESKVKKQTSVKVYQIEENKPKEQSFKSSIEESIRVSQISEEEDFSKSSNSKSEDDFCTNEVENKQEKSKKAHKLTKAKNKKVIKVINKPKLKSEKVANKKVNKINK